MINVVHKQHLVGKLLIFLALLLGCSPAIVNACEETSYPHDRTAFTQGLVYHAGQLFESTGRYGGHSSLRQVELETGRVLQKHALPADYFGEGLALHRGILYQLTWHNHLVLKYDPDNLNQLGRIKNKREAWGLASDGERMVMSDGSAVLRYVDPNDFSETARLQVHDDQGEVTGLNELEFIEGRIFANVYPTSRVVIIDPVSGQVIDSFNLDQLVHSSSPGLRRCIPNGIAYNPEKKCLLVTGKNCDRLLQISLP